MRATYQTKIWLQAKIEHIDVPPVVATTAWKRDVVSDSSMDKVPPISDVCVKLMTCSCKPKYKTTSKRTCSALQYVDMM